MKIKELEIKDVGGIQNLNLKFDKSMNIICGPNGIGKTTILECIANSFCTFGIKDIRRNAKSEQGTVAVKVEEKGIFKDKIIKISEFIPEKNNTANGFYELSKNLLSIKTSRWFGYMAIDSVKRDSPKDNNTTSNEAQNGINIAEVKGWFINRHMYSAHPDSLTPEQLHNFEIAKSSFSLLNESFSFGRVNGDTHDIMVKTPTGEIYYEYLSSGFKSCLSIIFGIIKDIEFRFKSPTIKIDEFDGVILIDEVELHLHPEWQGKIAGALIKTFPKAQFITTTHSPHVLQCAKSEQIIALSFNQNGGVFQRELPSGDYGFQGWSVEEILTDAMGMSDTKTDLFKKTISEFDAEISAENYSDAKAAYEKLMLLLHPSNHLRKILTITLASISEADK